MRKIWTIAWKELYMTFSDRNLVIILIAAPLAISTIIGLAFGGVGGGDVPISDIPVAIVNQDTGSGGQNYGAIFVNAFIPPAPTAGESALPACPLVETTAASGNTTTLDDLTNTVKLEDVDVARAGVDNGTYTAAIIIPADFSQQIGYSGPTDPVEPAGVEVYANSGRTIPASIIRSIVESIGNQIATGNIAIATTLDTIGAQYGFAAIGQVAGSESFSENVACAFTPVFNTLTIEQESIAGGKSNSTIALLVVFGSAQAMFFSLFTGQQGVLSIFDERKQWTLQRLIVAPTPRLYILLGKLVGTFVTCFVQLVALFVFLTIVGSIMSGGFVQIWGDYLGLVVVVLLAASLMATGLGTLLAGIARTPEQSAIIAQLINLVMAFIGGAFGFQLPEAIARFSLLYWGTNAFQKLASNQTDVGLNILVLSGFGVVLFGIGFWFFNRRLDI